MWSALTSDLNEFVSTVAGDTSDALNRMDENFPDGGDENGDETGKEELAPAAEERLRRMESHETFDLPLISDDDEEDYKKEVEEFLADFSLEAKTDEIAKLLEENPGTLKLAFEALVPTKVSYDDFWKRYFYRCDEERIAREIEEEEQEAEAARAETFKSISAVGNLLGGAVKAVSASLTDDGGDGTPKSQTTPGSGIFGVAGRPPFVLNTAVSEDEEEEEELGWDDDEEEGDDDNEEDDGEGQIEFKDAVTEKLQEELKLAIEERDQLHETVAMQQKEIVSLKTQGAENAEIEKLKTELFEKESELAALRASTQDSAGGSGDVEASENKELVALRKENGEMVSKIATLESAAKSSEDQMLELKKENEALQAKLADAEKRMQAAAELQQQKQEGEDSVESPETTSSAIKVDGPVLEDAGGEKGDEWDDDW